MREQASGECMLKRVIPCLDDVFATAEFYRDVLSFTLNQFFGDRPSSTIVERDDGLSFSAVKAAGPHGRQLLDVMRGWLAGEREIAPGRQHILADRLARIAIVAEIDRIEPGVTGAVRRWPTLCSHAFAVACPGRPTAPRILAQAAPPDCAPASPSRVAAAFLGLVRIVDCGRGLSAGDGVLGTAPPDRGRRIPLRAMQAAC
jgi:hypothetical protein